MNQYPKTLSILKRFITDRLARIYDSYEARSIAQQLLEDQFGVSLTDVLADKPLILNKEQSEKLDQDLERLYQGEPIQYITGKAHFFGRTFDVNRAVLIPRPETEELIQLILEENENLSSILDIGTGSGAIAITLKLELVEASVTAVDLSTSALEVAKKNASDLHAEVEFFEMDILKETPKGIFSAIVSNPPYVTQSEKGMMHKNVLDYEP
ncbi:MAG: peptide chain release factor N(5)-glutamine methyltransferase, partial [Cyclobacteriaceae bacterium]|nr:peptide chain release factor N(5)-glutamine methyltransferase [Cyclobacteriaceae bacterium]